MQTKTLACLLLVLHCSALLTHGLEGRTLLASTSIGTSSGAVSNSEDNVAEAGVSVRSTGGTARGEALASSISLSSATDAIAVAVGSAFAKASGGGSAKAIANAEAEAIGEAVAEVYITTISEVDIQGGGSGCAYSRGEGKSTAKALAAAFTKAVAKATNKYASKELRILQGAIVQGVAKVSASAHNKACLKGAGLAFSEQSIYVKAYIKVFAKSILNVLVGVKGAKGGALAKGVVAAGKIEGVEGEATDVSGVTGDGFAGGSTSGSGSTKLRRPRRQRRRRNGRRGF